MIISAVLPDYLGWSGQNTGPANAGPARWCIILTGGGVIQEAAGERKWLSLLKTSIAIDRIWLSIVWVIVEVERQFLVKEFEIVSAAASRPTVWIRLG